MTDWPDDLTVAPIREWPGALTTQRQHAKFKAPMASTLQTLKREIRELCDTTAQRQSAELLVAIDSAQFRRDGRPYANAKATHPGVIFSIDSRYGHLSYPCDTFLYWDDNLRAVALALEALRKVDHYGVTKRGEQYRGFLAIEAGGAPAEFTSDFDALMFLAGVTGVPYADVSTKTLVNLAKRKAHPDAGGDAGKFERVMRAERALRAAGRL